jgi:ribose-phosphate pyrophosphokinase
MMKGLSIFSGNSNRPLAEEIARHLGVGLGQAKVGAFSDGECFVEIGENVRGVSCFVVQPTSAPVNHNVMELLVMIDALKRASAGSIIAIIPYFGYARQDRKVKPRTPISAKLVADLISTAGADRVLSMDLHAGQIQGFFNVPFDHLFALPVMLEYMRDRFHGQDLVIVSPDAGGVERARAYSKRLNASLAIIDKRREGPNVSEVMNIIGEVEGKTAILLDDMIDTAGTLTNAAAALRKQGAAHVVASASHAVLSGPAMTRIEESCLEEVIVTNSIQLSDRAKQCRKIRTLSVGKLLAEAIRRIYHGDSISSLFE